jgi:hypothetical protein
MLDTTAGRWLVGAIVVLAVIALLAWARNDPGVGGRQPDPPTVVVVPVPATDAPTTVESSPSTTTVESSPSTTS